MTAVPSEMPHMIDFVRSEERPRLDDHALALGLGILGSWLVARVSMNTSWEWMQPIGGTLVIPFDGIVGILVALVAVYHMKVRPYLKKRSRMRRAPRRTGNGFVDSMAGLLHADVPVGDDDDGIKVIFETEIRACAAYDWFLSLASTREGRHMPVEIRILHVSDLPSLWMDGDAERRFSWLRKVAERRTKLRREKKGFIKNFRIISTLAKDDERIAAILGAGEEKGIDIEVRRESFGAIQEAAKIVPGRTGLYMLFDSVNYLLDVEYDRWVHKPVRATLYVVEEINKEKSSYFKHYIRPFLGYLKEK